MKLVLLMFLFIITGCHLGEEGLVAKQAYEELCPESRSIPFEKLTSKSSCKGINIIVAAFMNRDALRALKISTYKLQYLFQDARGFTDHEALENFRDPLTGKTLVHLIGEYGFWDEQISVFLDHNLYGSIMEIDSSGENYFHKFVRNKFVPVYYFGQECTFYDPGSNEITPHILRVGSLVYKNNNFGQTPMDLAASRGDFKKVWNLYECNPAPQQMAKIFSEYGADIAFQPRLSLYPELYDYLLPFLFEKKETEHSSFNGKTERWSLFELHFYSGRFAEFIKANERVFDFYMNDLEIMERLVMNIKRENDWQPDNYGQTSLYYYASSELDNSQLFRQIIERTKLDNQNFRGETIYHLMSKKGKVKQLKEILKRLPSRDILELKNTQGHRAYEVCLDQKTCDLFQKYIKN